jgi:hypothetical protein
MTVGYGRDREATRLLISALCTTVASSFFSDIFVTFVPNYIVYRV